MASAAASVRKKGNFNFFLFQHFFSRFFFLNPTFISLKLSQIKISLALPSTVKTHFFHHGCSNPTVSTKGRVFCRSGTFLYIRLENQSGAKVLYLWRRGGNLHSKRKDVIVFVWDCMVYDANIYEFSISQFLFPPLSFVYKQLDKEVRRLKCLFILPKMISNLTELFSPELAAVQVPSIEQTWTNDWSSSRKGIRCYRYFPPLYLGEWRRLWQWKVYAHARTFLWQFALGSSSSSICEYSRVNHLTILQTSTEIEFFLYHQLCRVPHQLDRLLDSRLLFDEGSWLTTTSRWHSMVSFECLCEMHTTGES